MNTFDKRKSLWRYYGVCLFYTTPNRTDTIPVLDSENKPTFLYELSLMIIFVKSIHFSDIYNTKCTTVYKDERTRSV